MNKLFVDKKLFVSKKLLSLFVLFLLLSCKGIASLPIEPILTGKNDPVSLASDEASLFGYALSLNAWLIDAKGYVNLYYKEDKFPFFENFDPKPKGGTGDAGLKARISYYKRYIEAIKPIAIAVYRKYTQVTLKE
ncbi:hypothetical protein KZ870_25435 [Pseudomonas aeruginosa]|nr:hypothetical protein [Pseudomonas aeruginosa]